METTTKQAVDAYYAIEKFIKLEKESKLFLLSAVRIRMAGNLRRLRPIASEFNNERNELVKRYGVKIEGEEERYRINQDKRKEFEAEFEAMLKETHAVEIKQIEPHEMAGVTKEEYENPKSDATKQNQVPIELIEELSSAGVLKE